jgi:hypothetical protein
MILLSVPMILVLGCVTAQCMPRIQRAEIRCTEGIRGAVNVVGHVETEKGFRPFDGADVLDRWNMIGLRRRVVQVPAGPDHISCFLPRLRRPGRFWRNPCAWQFGRFSILCRRGSATFSFCVRAAAADPHVTDTSGEKGISSTSHL